MGSCYFAFCITFKHFSNEDTGSLADFHAIAIGGILNCSFHVFFLIVDNWKVNRSD